MTSPPEAPRPVSSALTWLALLVALAGSFGTVWVSVGLKLLACPLCFYQRTLMFGVASVLLVGLLGGMERRVSLALLALPLAVAGAAVAGFHVYLEMSGKLECPKGMFALGTVPVQSLAAFGLLALLLLADVLGRKEEAGVAGLLGGLVLGAAIAAGSIASAPPLPAAPKEPYTQDLVGCRPPYQP